MASVFLNGGIESTFPDIHVCFLLLRRKCAVCQALQLSSCKRFLLWFPTPIGIFRQGQRWGLICATPVTEAEFSDPQNASDLRKLLRHLLRIKMLLGVQQLSFAGILPNVLRKMCPDTVYDRDRTSEVVRRAVHHVRREHFGERRHNVVLLGGAGRIGRTVRDRLRADGVDVIVIDSALPAATTFKDLGASGMLLVDASRYGVIQRHIPELPQGTVILNEVFPEPSREVVKELKSRNIVAYHLAGVKAEVYPSLPLGYRNAVPCCAIHSDDIGEPVLTRIA